MPKTTKDLLEFWEDQMKLSHTSSNYFFRKSPSHYHMMLLVMNAHKCSENLTVEELKTKFLTNMSIRSADMLQEDLQLLGPTKISLVEKAQQVIDEKDAERITKKMLKGQFTLEDMAEQLRQIKKMGSLEGLLGMLPGAQKIKGQMSKHNLDDSLISRQEAIILSMTLAERRNPKILNGSRRRRIASGSGASGGRSSSVMSAKRWPPRRGAASST